jgi:hypothetical protein
MKLQIALQGLLLGLVFVPSLAVEEIYKWVDKDGKVHFGVRTGDSAEVVKPKTASKPMNRASAKESRLKKPNPWPQDRQL